MSKKENKPNESTLAKKAIAKTYTTSPIIVSCEGGYAAVDKGHIQIFKYSKDTEDVSSVGTYYFEDYDIVIIDRFAIKAVMNFKGTNKDFEFISTEQTKEIENLLCQNTNLQVTKLERKWYNKILGFRSRSKIKMIIASIVYFFLLIATINGCMDKKVEQQKAGEQKKIQQDKRAQEHEEIMREVEKRQAKEKEAKSLKTDDGRPINVPLYLKYDVKYPAYPTEKDRENEDKETVKRFEQKAEEYNMSVPEYISKEKEIVAANRAKANEEATSNNNGAVAQSSDGSYSKDAIKTTLNRLNDNINSWKAMNSGKLNQNDIVAIKSDLKFVLEHVQDLESETGTNNKIDQFKNAVNAHINAFESGYVNNISKLIIQANSL
ncbi:TPA: hypothetical protein QCX89_003203 [Bacillus cereus]|nr:hypothetical protein [Bacillus cereus]